MSRTVAIVQARMGSTRLPGKVLMALAGQPMLAQVITRLQHAKTLDEVVVATTTASADDAIAASCAKLSLRCVRGAEHDVLARYCQAAKESAADIIVRITADCPLIDAATVDAVVLALDGADYASNVIERRFPRGLDAEALYADTLYRCARLARSGAAREHVTWFIREEAPALFIRHHLRAQDDHSALRWTVDTEADFTLVSTMVAHGAAAQDYPALLQLWHAHPEWWHINAEIAQKQP